MNKTIIGVWNNENTGKSSSITDAFYLLMAKGAKIDYSITDIASYSNPTINANETLAILKYNGIKIGFESQGDPKGRQFNTLPDLVKNQCEIIICASRPDVPTNDIIYKTSKSNYEIIWYSNFYFNDGNTAQSRQNLIHQFNGECIIKLVDDLISGKI